MTKNSPDLRTLGAPAYGNPSKRRSSIATGILLSLLMHGIALWFVMHRDPMIIKPAQRAAAGGTMVYLSPLAANPTERRPKPTAPARKTPPKPPTTAPRPKKIPPPKQAKTPEKSGRDRSPGSAKRDRRTGARTGAGHETGCIRARRHVCLRAGGAETPRRCRADAFDRDREHAASRRR
ncbi:hypothetical protein ACFS07_18665 [Undibacterium arcticum]